MFQLIVFIILVFCLLRLVARVSGWLLAILVVAAIIDPEGARIFVLQASQWVAFAWDRLMYVVGF